MDLGVAAGKRQDAIKLAKGSKWDELKRLVDAEPLAAQQTDMYGMLPLHWACTEPHSIGEGVLMALLKAFPAGARAANTAEMLPLQIAIKAQAKIEWLQALLASHPDAVLKKAPTGETALELARKANLPARSVRLLEEMFFHVCQKEGYAGGDHAYEDGAVAADQAQMMMMPLHHEGMRTVGSTESSFGDAPPPPMMANGMGSSRGGVTFAVGARSSRRPSNPEAYKARTYSDNDYSMGAPECTHRSTADSTYSRGVSISSNGSGSGAIHASAPVGGAPVPAAAKPMPYQGATQLSQRMVVSLPPRWTNAPNCHICSQKWSTFRKRHHCRNCGQSICGDHSARERMRLQHYGLPDKYRVCTVCHHMLRNAATEILQPSQGRVSAAPPPGRRSDEHLLPVPRRDSAGQVGTASGGSNFQLERHVSAPARSAVGTEYMGIHDQVANLQKQVSQLMEEKELAESQLRAQAELLGDSFSAERLTGTGRRDRLNSAPLKLPTTGPGSVSGGTPQSYGMQHLGAPGPLGSYEFGSRMTRSTASSADEMRDREGDYPYATNMSISSAVPEPPTSNESGPVDAMVRLQEDLGKISFMSSYSEFDDRSTELYVDDLAAITGMHIPDDMLEEESEEEGEYNDDDADEGDSTLPEVEVLVNLGLSLLNKGSTSAAVQAFTRAVEICPDTSVLYSYLAKAYYADENLDAAVEALETSLALEPSAANSTLLGKILFEKGDHEKAIMAYQKSLEIQNA